MPALTAPKAKPVMNHAPLIGMSRSGGNCGRGCMIGSPGRGYIGCTGAPSGGISDIEAARPGREVGMAAGGAAGPVGPCVCACVCGGGVRSKCAACS